MVASSFPSFIFNPMKWIRHALLIPTIYCLLLCTNDPTRGEHGQQIYIHVQGDRSVSSPRTGTFTNLFSNKPAKQTKEKSSKIYRNILDPTHRNLPKCHWRRHRPRTSLGAALFCRESYIPHQIQPSTSLALEGTCVERVASCCFLSIKQKSSPTHPYSNLFSKPAAPQLGD